MAYTDKSLLHITVLRVAALIATAALVIKDFVSSLYSEHIDIPLHVEGILACTVAFLLVICAIPQKQYALSRFLFLFAAMVLILVTDSLFPWMLGALWPGFFSVPALILIIAASIIPPKVVDRQHFTPVHFIIMGAIGVYCCFIWITFSEPLLIAGFIATLIYLVIAVTHRTSTTAVTLLILATVGFAPTVILSYLIAENHAINPIFIFPIIAIPPTLIVLVFGISAAVKYRAREIHAQHTHSD